MFVQDNPMFEDTIVDNSIAIYSLTPNSFYKFRVRANNEIGSSGFTVTEFKVGGRRLLKFIIPCYFRPTNKFGNFDYRSSLSFDLNHLGDWNSCNHDKMSKTIGRQNRCPSRSVVNRRGPNPSPTNSRN
jgi:hypothetical protein